MSTTKPHQGVIGIVAARIKDRFHRPAIAFARADDGSLKGSARSIAGVHVRDALDDVAAAHPGLINRFGGHAMAAGLTLDDGRLADFEQAFSVAVAARLDDEIKTRRLLSDGPLAAAEFDRALAVELATVLPWGQGCPEPRFDGEFVVEDCRVVGARHARLVLRAADATPTQTVAAIAFGAAAAPWARRGARIQALYKLDLNDYGGVETVQLVIEHALAL